MKRVPILLLLAVLTWSGVQAQDDPIPPPRRARAAKVGAVGGFTTGWLFLNARPINEFLTAGQGGAVGEDGVFMIGGSGAAYIMVIKNFRLGGVGMSGSVSSSRLGPGNVRRDAELRAGYGAVTLEYVVPLMERFDLVGGIALGSGGIDLVLRKNNGTPSTWQAERSSFDTTSTAASGNISRTLSGNFLIWVPSVNLEYAFMGWLGARLGVSYVGMSLPSWKVDDTFDLENVPSRVNGKGWMINMAILVGTF